MTPTRQVEAFFSMAYQLHRAGDPKMRKGLQDLSVVATVPTLRKRLAAILGGDTPATPITGSG